MSTIGTSSHKCPFCGKRFNCTTQLSYTTFGIMLDFKPYGAACIPTPVPQCPKCSFVFFEDLFSENEITNLKEKLKTNNIFELEPDMPKYYYLARELELLEKDIDSIIHYYLCAIWQGGSIVNENISDILFSYIGKIAATNEKYYIYKLIQIDLLRRRKIFDIAIDLIIMLKKDSTFPKKEYGKVLDYQLILIEEMDTDEHEMSDAKLAKYKNPHVRKAIAKINGETWYDLRDIPNEAKTEEFWLEVVSVHGQVFRQVPQKMKNYKMHLAAVKGDELSLESIPKKFITEEVCLAAIKNERGTRVLQHVPENLKTPEICLNAVKKAGDNLRYVPEELKTPEMCLIAAKELSVHLMKYIPKHFLTPEICLKIVKNKYKLFTIPLELRTLEVCLASVRNNGDNLKDVPEKLKTLKMCLLAVQKYVSWGRNLQYVPEKFKTLEVCLAAYKNEPDGAKNYIPKELLDDVVSRANI
jgi:hypothetical protein